MIKGMGIVCTMIFFDGEDVGELIVLDEVGVENIFFMVLEVVFVLI